MIEVSIIIPTRNRVELLRKAIDSVLNQKIDKTKYELIIIDNDSNDNTYEVITNNYIKNYQNVKIISEKRIGLHNGRNTGFKNAIGNIVSFLDDDVILNEGWIKSVIDTFKIDNDIVLAGGNNIPDYEAVPPEWVEKLFCSTENGKYNSYFSTIEFGDYCGEINPYYIFGCNFSVRKNFIEMIEGFHPDGMPKDFLKYRGDGECYVSSQVIKFSKKAYFNKNISLKHLVSKNRINYDYLYNRSFAEGCSNSYTYIRNKKSITKEDVWKIKYFKENKKIMNSDDEILNQKINTGYWDGYLFHMLEAINDTGVFEWIKRKNYL